MIVTKALYNLGETQKEKTIDFVSIAWYQVSKRLQRLQTASGVEIAIRFLGKGQRLLHGDVLFEDDNSCVVVNVLPCEVIELATNNPLLMAEAAFEIGNKHLPLFWGNGKLLIPFEKGVMDWLTKSGFEPSLGIQRLTEPFEANVNPDHYKVTYSLNTPLKLIVK